MMQQRLKAKLMVARWGSEAVPGAGWRWAMWAMLRGNEAEGRALRAGAVGKEAAGQDPCKAGGDSAGLGGSRDESCSTTTFQMSLCATFVLPFSLTTAEKWTFDDRVHLGACFPELVMALTQFPTATHTRTQLHFCASWAKGWAELSPSYRQSLRHPHWQIYLEVILNQITCAPSEQTCMLLQT